MEKRLIFLLISQLILAISCRAAPLKDDNVQQDEKNVAPGDTTQDCEFEGIVYKNGDKVEDKKKACESCHCIAGEVTCSVISCGQPPEGECTAVVAEGECCPTYDCVDTVRQDSESTVVEGEMSDLTTVITPSIRENLDNEEVLEQVEPEAVESSTLVNDENTEQNELALRTIGEDVTTEEPEGDMQEPTVAESTFREIIVNSPNELSEDNTTPVPEMVDESDGQISGGEFRNEILLEDQVDPTGRSVIDETTLSPFSDDVARTEVPVSSEGTKAEGKDSTPMEKSEEDYWSELLRSEAIHEDGKSSSAAVEETENVATEKTRENSEESATLRSIPLAEEAEDSTNRASEARTDASVREESTDASLREESTESSVNELEVVPKIFRSEIDNLKFPLEEENSDSYILSQDEATTEALESRSEDELTTVGAELRSSAAEATTVLPEEARTGDEEDDYWKNMMLGQSDPVDTMKNIDSEVDASESKNVESVTENIALEDTTALFFRSNLGEDGLGDTEERVEGEVTTERTISDELRLDEEENEDSATESLVRAEPDDVEVTTLSSNEADNDAPLRERSGLTVEEATTPIVDSAQDVRDSETETETETGIETEGTEEEPSTAGDDVLGLKSEATTLIPNDESSPEDSSAASSGEPAQKNDEASDQETESVPESESNDGNDEESSPENRDADLSKQEESNATKSENVDSKISSESNSIQSDEKDEQVSNESTNVPSTPKVKRKRMFEKIVKPPSQLHKFPQKSDKYPRKLMVNNTKRIASKFHHLASKYGLRPVVRKSRRYGGRSLIRNARL